MQPKSSAKIGYHPDFVEYRKLLLDAGLREVCCPPSAPIFDRGEAERKQARGIAASRMPPAPPARLRFATSPRCCAACRPTASSPKSCSPSNSPPPIPRVLGINLVMPEDGYISMTDYQLHMQMIDALRTFYPEGAHQSLHAGEIALGLVPPEGLKFHIRSAIDVKDTPSASATALTSWTRTAPTTCSKRWPPNASWSKSISPATMSFST